MLLLTLIILTALYFSDGEGREAVAATIILLAMWST